VAKYYTDVVKLYAEAFFDYALSENILKKISKEVEKLHAVFLVNPQLLEIISAPIYSAAEQKSLLEDIVKNLSLSDETSNLLGVLAQNKRLMKLMDVLEFFDSKLIEHSGSKIVEAIVSQELSKKEQDSLKEKLEKALSSKVELLLKIDQNILGGVVIKIDNKMLDASLANKFNHLSDIVESKIALL
jgi:F-type H+-transporting ATPase subunit delta